MQSSELLRAALAFPHIHMLSSYRDFTDLHSPAGPSRHRLPKNHNLQSRASRSTKPSTASLADSIPGENKHSCQAETTKEIWMQPECEQGRTLQQLRWKSLQQSKALAGGGLPAALLYHHNTEHTQNTVTAPAQHHLSPTLSPLHLLL